VEPVALDRERQDEIPLRDRARDEVEQLGRDGAAREIDARDPVLLREDRGELGLVDAEREEAGDDGLAAGARLADGLLDLLPGGEAALDEHLSGLGGQGVLPGGLHPGDNFIRPLGRRTPTTPRPCVKGPHGGVRPPKPTVSA
jgi:hypothetical protein